MDYQTNTVQETQELGKRIGESCRGGEIFALVGELGAGKTTFVQGFAQGVGIKKRIVSPTFIIMRSYELPNKTLYHIDLYRLERDAESEIVNLGLPDIWGKENAIVVIEWAEKIKDKIPQNSRWISFSVIDDQHRKISLS